MVSDAIRRSGMAGVAVAGTLSFIATTTMFCYALFLSVVLRRDKDGSASRPYARAIKFLRTQSGRYFLNLVFSDMIQGLGFALNYRWIYQKEINMSGGTCTFQGLAIQIGDIASAFWVTTIAIHTMITLALRKHPPKWTMYTTIVFNWCFVAILAIVGPAVLKKPNLGPFYAPAGGWCWIDVSYEEARLWLHYFFIFIAITVNTICYSITFIMLRHQAFKPSDTVDPNSPSESPVQEDNPGTYPRLDTVFAAAATYDEKAINRNPKSLHISIPTTKPHPAMSSSGASTPISSTNVDVLPSWLVTTPSLKGNSSQYQTTYHSYGSTSSLVERTARKMLWYPPVYLILCLPLAAYRLAGIAGHDWTFAAQIACGCVFSLAGLGNVCLYWVTRKMGPGPMSSFSKRVNTVMGDGGQRRKQSTDNDVKTSESLSPITPKEIRGFGGTTFWDTWRRDPGCNNHHCENTYSGNTTNGPRALDFQKTWDRQRSFTMADSIQVETSVEMSGDYDIDGKESISDAAVETRDNSGKVSPTIPENGTARQAESLEYDGDSVELG